MRNQLVFEFEDSDNWKLSELTINPFIYAKNKAGIKYACDIWIELCLTPTKEHVSLPKSTIFMDWMDERIQPFAKTRLDHDKPELEINQIMYAEIWFACIRSYFQRGDFMRTGYNKASRLATPSLDIDKRLKPLDIRTFSSPSDLQREICDIYNRYQLLNQFFHKKNDTEYTLPKNLSFGKTTITVREDLLSHIAFCRKPWYDNLVDGTVLYPTNPRIEYDVRENYSKIDFDYCFPTDIKRSIKTGESIGCWLVFSELSVKLNPAGEGRSFEIEFDLETNVEVVNSNMFFRTPPYYKVLDRGYTPLSSYNTPPQLFSLWDKHLNSAFYASKNKHFEAGSRHTISSTFGDSRYEFDKLVALFLLGIIISTLMPVPDLKEDSHMISSLFVGVMVTLTGALLYQNKSRYPLFWAVCIIPPVFLFYYSFL